jgi:hypothetical protein
MHLFGQTRHGIGEKERTQTPRYVYIGASHGSFWTNQLFLSRRAATMESAKSLMQVSILGRSGA